MTIKALNEQGAKHANSQDQNPTENKESNFITQNSIIEDESNVQELNEK